MQRALGCLLACLAFLPVPQRSPAAAAPKADAVEAEFARISGEWRLVACAMGGIEFPADVLRKAKVTITGRTLQVRPAPVTSLDVKSGKRDFLLRDAFVAKLVIDPTTKPASVELDVEDEEGTHRLKGIYKLDAGKLSILYSTSGKRPVGFDAGAKRTFRLFVLQRDRK